MGQIVDVMKFEIMKNRKKFLIVFIFEVILALLSILLPPLISDQPLPSEITNYLQGSFGFFTFFLIIAACAYGGSLIADEFDKKTCYMLFPKVSKPRLFIGKVVSQYLLFALNLALYYLFVTVAALINYDEAIPWTFLYSFLIALLYSAMIYAFVVLLSSFLKSTSMTVIVAFLMLLMGFGMVQGIVTLIAYEVEPFFDITYLQYMITAAIDFPSPRYEDITIPVQEGVEFTMRNWYSPILSTGMVFTACYLIGFLVLAYIRFLHRESK